MLKLKQALTSKTVWAIIILFLVTNLEAVKSLIPVNYLPIVETALSILAILGKIFPSQDYTQK